MTVMDIGLSLRGSATPCPPGLGIMVVRTCNHWAGQLRAIGDVLRDQLFSMSRVGFNAYATRQDRSIHDALKGLTVFSETYQASVDQPLPLFRRAERDVCALAAQEPVTPEVIAYLNRLSDLLFVLARAANGDGEAIWVPGAGRA